MDMIGSFNMKDGYGDFLQRTWSLRNGEESSMQCNNKDEAQRSRAIAEQKFLQHDLVGAKCSALKAQCLCPELEGIPQFLAVLDVYIVAQKKKVDGVKANWYEILQIDADADQAMIRKQYRKLALILHPDKNKAMGAEGAFKLVSEAWHVLSDKEKKADHDAKRMASTSRSPTSNPMRGFYHFTPSCHSMKFKERQVPRNSCPFCKMEIECSLNSEINSDVKISCPGCGKTVSSEEQLAEKCGSSFGWEQPSAATFKVNLSQVNNQRRKKFFPSGFRFLWGNHSANRLAKYKAVAKATAEIVQETYEMVKRERIKAQKEARETLAKQIVEEKEDRSRDNHPERALKKRQGEEIIKEANEGRSFGNRSARVNLHPSTFEHRVPVLENNSTTNEDVDSYPLIFKAKQMMEEEGDVSSHHHPDRAPRKRLGEEIIKEAKEGRTSFNNRFARKNLYQSTFEQKMQDLSSNINICEDSDSCPAIFKHSIGARKESNVVRVELSDSNIPLNGHIESNCSNVRYVLSSRVGAI